MYSHSGSTTMAISPRASIWRSSERIAIDFPDPVAPVMRKCSHSIERGMRTPARLDSSPVVPPCGSAKLARKPAGWDQSEPPELLPLAMIFGVTEDQIADRAHAQARR